MNEHKERSQNSDNQALKGSRLPYAKLLVMAPDLLGSPEPTPDCGMFFYNVSCSSY